MGYPSVYDYVMSQVNVVTRVNDLVQNMDRPFVDLAGSSEASGETEGSFFLDYSEMRIHGIGGNLVLLGPVLIPE